MKRKIKILIACIIGYLFLLGISALALIGKGHPFNFDLLLEACILLNAALAFTGVIFVSIIGLCKWIDKE